MAITCTFDKNLSELKVSIIERSMQRSSLIEPLLHALGSADSEGRDAALIRNVTKAFTDIKLQRVQVDIYCELAMQQAHFVKTLRDAAHKTQAKFCCTNHDPRDYDLERIASYLAQTHRKN